MREVEVKAKVENLVILIDKLKQLGCDFGKPIFQNDQIFLPKGSKLTDDLHGKNVLRIRKNNDKIIFTLKQPIANELDCIEKEVLLEKAQLMPEILELLGYYETVKVNKKRLKCKYKEYQICIDEVDDLGSFVEVEKITDEDGLKVQDELFNFLESLGVKRENRVLQGYDTLMYNKINIS